MESSGSIAESPIEERKADVPMQVARPQKANLIQLYLNRMEKVSSRDEAVKLTELLLQRYKGRLD